MKFSHFFCAIAFITIGCKDLQDKPAKKYNKGGKAGQGGPHSAPKSTDPVDPSTTYRTNPGATQQGGPGPLPEGGSQLPQIPSPETSRNAGGIGLWTMGEFNQYVMLCNDPPQTGFTADQSLILCACITEAMASIGSYAEVTADQATHDQVQSALISNGTVDRCVGEAQGAALTGHAVVDKKALLQGIASRLKK